MISIGLDDTDSLDSRGTNQLAKFLVRSVLADYRCLRIVRHQLFFDERIPYTSKNGSASIWLDEPADVDYENLFQLLSQAIRNDFVHGSDPGLCLTNHVPQSIVDFGQRCQQTIVTMEEATKLASTCGIRLAGLGGTNGGVIGALAAVGLAATNNDGRIVQLGNATDEISGVHPIARLSDCSVNVIDRTGATVSAGLVDVGKKLRPNLRNGRTVLFVEPIGSPRDAQWKALKVN